MNAARQAGLLALLLGLVVDQAHKWYMLGPFAIESRQPVSVLPVFDWVLVWNRGVSYGLFTQDSDLGRWVLIAVGLAASAFFIWWLWHSDRRLMAVAAGLIAGGGISNVIDRLVYGAVVDNFLLHYQGAQWYVFNLADVWICAGFAGLVLAWWTERPEKAADG
ncbi:MAG TPA: signal peptidase II [Afifellaceae bacterium]|nr:signal peptidase II [Afifellaceae bacterium]